MTTLAELEAKLAAQEAETARLREELRQLPSASAHNTEDVIDITDDALASAPVSRRAALSKAAVAIAGVATGAAILRPTAAAATDGVGVHGRATTGSTSVVFWVRLCRASLYKVKALPA
jgi:hypothetical protein